MSRIGAASGTPLQISVMFQWRIVIPSHRRQPTHGLGDSMTDEPDLISYEYVVYFYSVQYDEPGHVWLDDVIEAGIKALGIEKTFQFVESDMRDSGHF